MAEPDPVFDPDDPAFCHAVLAAFAEDDPSAKPGVDYSPFGVMLVVLSLVIFGGMSALLPATLRPWLGGAAGIGVFLGILLSMFGSAFVAAGPYGATEAAASILTARPAADSARRLQAAVALVKNAYYSGGPWTRATFEFDEMGQRLGASLPLVEAVERVLVQEAGVYRVFTPLEPAESASRDTTPS